MSLRLLPAILFLALTFTGCGDSSPQSQLSDINELLSKDFPITTEQKAETDKLISEGKRLLQEGKTSESSQALASAFKILKQAEDAAMFNKSE